jgi:hypothetical protein
MSAQYAPLIERLSRLVRDRGDIDLLLGLDRIMDHSSVEDQTMAFRGVLESLNQRKSGKSTAGSSGQGTANV